MSLYTNITRHKIQLKDTKQHDKKQIQHCNNTKQHNKTQNILTRDTLYYHVTQ